MLRPVWVLPMGHAFRKVSKCQLVCQDHGSKATPAEPGGLGSSQLAGDRCRNLTRLLFPALSLPSLTPSQSHHQGLSCNLLSWWMRQGAPHENTRILSPGAASSQKSPQRFLPFFFSLFWIFNNAFTKPGPNYSPLPSPARSKSPASLQSITGRQLSSQLGPRASRAVPSPATGSLSHTHTHSCSPVQCRTARSCQPTGWRNQDRV